MPSGAEWLVMMPIMVVLLFGVLWFVVRSAVRSGVRAVEGDSRDTSLRDR